MTTEITREGKKTFVRLEGRLDTTNAGQFQKDIAPLLEDPEPDIEFDCAGMEYTSSQGLRLFLILQKTVTMKKGAMLMRNMRSQVKEVFDITGFSTIIKIV